MSRTTIAALGAAAVVLSLTACAGPGAGAQPSAPPHPTASHSPAAASGSPTPTPAAPAATLSTTPGDELLTFSGTASNGVNVAAISFTIHSPVAWNSAGGASTLAALAAAGVAPTGDTARLLDPAWDAAHAVSLAVVDYSARMTSGTWPTGNGVELDLGPLESEVPVSTTGLSLDLSRWSMTAPGAGHFVIAYPNVEGSTPDPSTWADSLQIYGLGLGLSDVGGSSSYDFSDCRLDLTPLGRTPAAVANWFDPTTTYCSAGIGD